ncbi:related to dna excision repair protein ercc-1 [Ustilago trichophora]|uniref:DNA excision repair protein ERCC-1 n=1 Tax=Ustilago trichophora TaxID=86804 RepID=A0A5C3EMC6_9BASI|nr:related to dna excision repair protein ercc-1 [Ustilago trichophora]
MAGSDSGGDGPLRPMSSFQPASSLPRDMNASSSSTNTSTTSTSTSSGVTQPRPRPIIRGALGNTNTILVNPCQRGNPLLPHIRSIGWEYADIIPDYQVGLSSCILFLSLRYHRLHPEYVHTRISKLSNMFTLRILLVLCDVNDHQSALKELTKLCIINNLSLILCWSAEEAGRYVETYKSFEHKPPDLIKERIGEDYLSQVTNVLTQVRGVNRTDVVTLLSRFGSLKGVVKGAMEGEEVGMCPGFGEVKAKRLRDVFNQSFRVGETRRYKDRKVGNNDVGVAHNTSTTTTTTTTTTTSNNKRALDTLQDSLDTLEEDEQLRLALQLSLPSP